MPLHPPVQPGDFSRWNVTINRVAIPGFTDIRMEEEATPGAGLPLRDPAARRASFLRGPDTPAAVRIRARWMPPREATPAAASYRRGQLEDYFSGWTRTGQTREFHAIRGPDRMAFNAVRPDTSTRIDGFGLDLRFTLAAGADLTVTWRDDQPGTTLATGADPAAPTQPARERPVEPTRRPPGTLRRAIQRSRDAREGAVVRLGGNLPANMRTRWPNLAEAVAAANVRTWTMLGALRSGQRVRGYQYCWESDYLAALAGPGPGRPRRGATPEAPADPLCGLPPGFVEISTRAETLTVAQLADRLGWTTARTAAVLRQVTLSDERNRENPQFVESLYYWGGPVASAQAGAPVAGRWDSLRAAALHFGVSVPVLRQMIANGANVRGPYGGYHRLYFERDGAPVDLDAAAGGDDALDALAYALAGPSADDDNGGNPLGDPAPGTLYFGAGTIQGAEPTPPNAHGVAMEMKIRGRLYAITKGGAEVGRILQCGLGYYAKIQSEAGERDYFKKEFNLVRRWAMARAAESEFIPAPEIDDDAAESDGMVLSTLPQPRGREGWFDFRGRLQNGPRPETEGVAAYGMAMAEAMARNDEAE